MVRVEEYHDAPGLARAPRAGARRRLPEPASGLRASRGRPSTRLGRGGKAATRAGAVRRAQHRDQVAAGHGAGVAERGVLGWPERGRRADLLLGSRRLPRSTLSHGPVLQRHVKVFGRY